MSVLHHYYNVYKYIPPVPLCRYGPSVIKSCLVTVIVVMGI